MSEPSTPPPLAPVSPPTPGPQRVATALSLAAVGLLGLLTLVGRYSVSPPLVLIAALTVLPWLWLVVTLLLGLLALVFRSRGAALVALVSAVFFSAIWLRAWIAWPTADQDGIPLRMMSWNVQRLGFEDKDDSPRMRCVAEEIERQDPDVLALLEVSARDIERLSQRLDLACVQVDYRGTGESGLGGLAACARGARWRLGEHAQRRFAQDIDWYYVFGEMVPVAEGPDAPVFNLLTVHLQPHGVRPEDEPDEIIEHHNRETLALLDRMGRLQDPTILAGDFNSARDAAIHVRLRQHLVDAWEQAGWGPGFTVKAKGILPLRIDYIYATPAFGVKQAWIPEADCSDHRPVVADLSLHRLR